MELKIGDVVQMGGRSMRYLGDGRFEPVDEPVLAKRHDALNDGPLVGGSPHFVRTEGFFET